MSNRNDHLPQLAFNPIEYRDSGPFSIAFRPLSGEFDGKLIKLF